MEPDKDMEETMNKEDGEKERSDSQQEAASQQEDHESKGRGETGQKKDSTQQSRLWCQWWTKWLELDWTTLERTQVIFNGLLTAFTILYALTTLWQFKYLIGKDRLDQRAWVGIVQHGGPPKMIADVPYIWKFMVRNSGKTPALKVRNIIGYGEGLKGHTFVPAYQTRGPEEKLTTVIQPGERIFLHPGPVIMPQKAIDALKGGTVFVYVYGQIQYDDIFGATHCTMFCYVLGTELPHLASCTEYNEVRDTECENTD